MTEKDFIMRQISEKGRVRRRTDRKKREDIHMLERFKTIYRGGSGEIVEKKSE